MRLLEWSNHALRVIWSANLTSARRALEQRRKLSAHFAHCFLRQLADELGAPDAPVKIFHLIGEDHAA